VQVKRDLNILLIVQRTEVKINLISNVKMIILDTVCINGR